MFALALRHAERLDPAARAELLEAQAHECMLTNLPEQAIRARLAAVDLRRERGDRQPELEVENFRLPDIGPGDILDFSYEYFAQASTGFGETGIFAAIGDPFDLSAGGGRFDLHVGDAGRDRDRAFPRQARWQYSGWASSCSVSPCVAAGGRHSRSTTARSQTPSVLPQRQARTPSHASDRL